MQLNPTQKSQAPIRMGCTVGKMPCLSKLRKAFTLIEMLIVISIISILLAVLFPAIATIKARTNATADAGNLKTLNEAIVRARELKGDNNAAISISATNAADAIAYLQQAGYIYKNPDR